MVDSHSKIAFDPGHTTGIAVSQDSRVILVTAVNHAIALPTIEALLSAYHPAEAVVEGIPRTGTEAITARLFHGICFLLEAKKIPYKVVLPGTWKPMRKRVPPAWEPHLRDAAELLGYLG